MLRAASIPVFVGIWIGVSGVAAGQACDPQASFDGPTRFGVPYNSTSLAMADLDGDGVSDLVVADQGFGTIEVMLGDGAGGFGDSAVYAVGAEPLGVAIGDLDGDGVLDVLVANRDSGDVSVLFGVGDGSLREAVSYPGGTRPVYPTLGDLDGDGDLDAVVIGAGGFEILENLGGGVLAPARTIGDGDRVGLPLLGDLDGDGDLDLVTNAPYTTSFYLNNGDGTFAPQVLLETAPWASGIALGDVDGDGDLDIVGVDERDHLPFDALVLFRNDGEARFDYETTLIAGLANGLLLEDMDGDGDLDLVSGGSGDDAATVLLNDGNGGLAPSGRYVVVFSESSFGTLDAVLASGDLDGDALPDLVAVPRSSTSGVVVRNLGGGRFASSQRLRIGEASSPTDLHLADLDSDGLLDVLVEIDGGPGPFVYYASSTVPGLYESPVVLFSSTGLSRMALGDFDGDGLTDVAAGGSLQGRTAFNRGGRDFEVSDSTILQADMLSAGDLDGDGLDDLVSAMSRIVTSNLSTGDGTYTRVSRHVLSVPVADLVLYDLDGDGNRDLLLATGSGLQLMSGDGMGMLGELTMLVPIDWPESLALGDLNNDGVMDAATAGREGVSFMLGDGAAGFNLAQTVPVQRLSLDEGRPIALGDVNADGALDAIVTLDEGERAVLLNNGDATFGFPQAVAADGTLTLHVAAGDFDGDGDVDIASADVSGGEAVLTVLYNHCRPADCPPDLDGDGELTVFDYLSFFNLFDAGSTRADFDGDGSLTIFDFLAFQNEFDAGCS